MSISARSGYFGVEELGERSTQFYREQGYLVVPCRAKGAEADDLIDETLAICRGKRGDLTAGETAEANTKIGVPKASGPTPEEVASLCDDDLLARYLVHPFPHKCSPA